MSNTPPVTNTASRTELMRKGVPGEDGLEAVMMMLSLPPGGAAPAHRHPGISVGYVLEGIYETQYEGEDLMRLTAGEATYDLANTPHLIARNGSDTKPLRLLVTFIVRKGEPTTLPL